MLIRIGVEGGRQAVLERARVLGAPLLVSANSLWCDRQKAFRGWEAYAGHDVALDSGGFVAMKRYGRYRWSVDDYAGLAWEMEPSWWAQMDFCCEPEIAADSAQVARRIDLTVKGLHACRAAAERAGVPAPMPVLQGWKPADYCSGPAYDAGFIWPSLVGIGSVCRRQVGGPDGVLAVVEALDGRVPAGVQFHLFGVKSTALRLLVDRFPGRIASVDSMAWHRQCSWDCHKAGVQRTNERRAESMAEWYTRQSKNAAPRSNNQPNLL